MQPADLYEASIAYFLRPIASLRALPQVTEIMINGHDEIWYETKGKLHRSEFAFESESALLAAVRNIAEYNGKVLSDATPSMDGRLPDGSRIHAIVPPAARRGVTVTIRQFRKSTFSLDNLVAQDSMSPMAAEFLSLSVKMHRNLVVSGGTGTGKTSLLNALSACIPRNERVVVIEDTSELQLASDGHIVSLEAQLGDGEGRPRITIRDLFVDSLRMRPDRIVVGEVRRGEALDLIQSMISGHAGALTTVHANTPRDAVTRLETLCLMSDTQLPVYVARQQVASAVQLVVQLARLSDGSRRVVAISECCGLDRADEHGQYQWNDLFRFITDGRDPDGKIRGGIQPTGRKSTQPELLELYALKNEVHHSAPLWD